MSGFSWSGFSCNSTEFSVPKGGRHEKQFLICHMGVVVSHWCWIRILVFVSLLMGILGCVTTSRDNDFFPYLSLSQSYWSHEFRAQWFSGILKSMGEKSLLRKLKATDGGTTWRLLCTSDDLQGECFRIECPRGGSMVLHKVRRAKVGCGEVVGYNNKERCLCCSWEHSEITLRQEQVEQLESALKDMDFWKMPSEEWRTSIADGEIMVLEIVADGRYHVIVRESLNGMTVSEMMQLLGEQEVRKRMDEYKSLLEENQRFWRLTELIRKMGSCETGQVLTNDKCCK